MSEKEFADVLIELMTRRHLTCADLARGLGCSAANIYGYRRKGRLVSQRVVKRFAEYFGITVAQMTGVAELSDDPYTFSGLYSSLNIPYVPDNDGLDKIIENPARIMSFRTIPIPVWMFGGKFDPCNFKRTGKQPLLITVRTGAMSAAGVPRGAYALVDACRDVMDGDIVLVRLHKMYSIRWLHQNKGGGILAGASSEYVDWTFTKADIVSGEYCCLGVIICVIQPNLMLLR